MLDNELFTLALLKKNKNSEVETYDGETEVTLLDSDRTFKTAGKLVNQDLKAKLGYEVIHGGMEITTEEWVSEGAPGIGPGSSGTGPSTITYHPKEYTVDGNNVSITDPVAYPGGIVMKQGIPLYSEATSFTIVDSGLTIATNGKRLNSDIMVDISALETLAAEISEVVG